MNNIEPLHKPFRKLGYRIILFMPILVSTAWIISLKLSSKAVIVGREGISLSPIRDTGPLITSLIIFTLSYLIFIAFLFSDYIKMATRWIIRRI